MHAQFDLSVITAAPSDFETKIESEITPQVDGNEPVTMQTSDICSRQTEHHWSGCPQYATKA